MSANAIYHVTRALRRRLEQVAGEGSVFVGQPGDPDVGSAALILFLYRIMPNASLRNGEHRVHSDDAPYPVIVFRNALPLDLHYLLTVGAGAGGSEEIPLQMLGAAMQALQRQPALMGPEVGNETVHVSLDPLTTDDTSRVWALFPTASYRTSVAYLARPVWIDPESPEISAARVVEDTLGVGARATLPEVSP